MYIKTIIKYFTSSYFKINFKVKAIKKALKTTQGKARVNI